MAQAINPKTVNKILQFTTGLAAIDGMICLIMLLLIPSDSQSAWILGYSRSRILMLVVCLSGICIFAGMSIWLYLQSDRAIKVSAKIEATLQKDRFTTIIVVLFLSFLILSLVYLVFAFTNLDYRVPSDAVTSMEQVKAYVFRLSPFVVWSALISGQNLFVLTYMGFGTKGKYLRAVQFLSIVIWPVLLVIFWGANQVDPYYYVTVAKEDNLVEWATVVFFLLAGFLSFFRAVHSGSRSKWFYLIFGVGCILFALEEISWGQRLFGLESSNFFVENSDQQEINVHNVINERFSIRTKHVAALVLFSYGAIFPLAAINRNIRVFANKLNILVPPLILVPGFMLASFLTIDLFFSGQDEEVAELFFSMLLFLTIVFQFLIPSGDKR